MKPSLTVALRSRAVLFSVHVLLWVLLYLSLLALRGNVPVYRESGNSAESPRTLKPVVSLHRLYTAPAPASIAGQTNLLNPFYTRHFTPPPAPSPPAPTTRKIQLVYQGFYEAPPGPKKVVVKLGEEFLISSLGSRLTANLYSTHATITTLVLTNTGAATNVLTLNTPKELEVPIQ